MLHSIERLQIINWNRYYCCIVVTIHAAENEVDHLDYIMFYRTSGAPTHLVRVEVWLDEWPYPIKDISLQLFADPIRQSNASKIVFIRGLEYFLWDCDIPSYISQATYVIPLLPL